MKLIYITNSRLPTAKAHGHQIIRMCREFSQQGVEVTLLWPTRKNPIGADIFAYYDMEKNFSGRQIKCFDFIAWEKYLGKLSYFLQAANFLRRLLWLSFDRQAIVYTRKPEIAWLCKLKGQSVFFESHEWFGRGRRLALWLLKKVDGIVTTNKYLKQEFIKHAVAADKILVCPHGVDLDLFGRSVAPDQALAKLELTNGLTNKKILLYTGSYKTMNFSKGLDEILRALKILHDDKLIFLAIGGSSENIVEYQAMAGALGVAGQVRFLLPVSQEKLGYFQQAANLLLMPFPDHAHFRQFMAPLKMFEYLAAGRPIIASDLPSIREVLTNNNAFFCQPGSAEDLAEQISFVFNHQELAKQKALVARQLAENYSWRVRAKKILNFIDDKS